MPVKQEQFTPAIWFELKLSPLSSPVGYYTEVSGLAAEIEVKTYNEGGLNDRVHKLPTRMKYPNLVLKRGVTRRRTSQEWLGGLARGSDAARTVSLTMAPDGEGVRDLELQRTRTRSSGPGPNLNAAPDHDRHRGARDRPRRHARWAV